uniref:Uncharacterized protein n=1 Tax=Arundo donax TaxID=35708 RepID=A0A0A9AQ38_ARUDO
MRWDSMELNFHPSRQGPSNSMCLSRPPSNKKREMSSVHWPSPIDDILSHRVIW